MTYSNAPNPTGIASNSPTPPPQSRDHAKAPRQDPQPVPPSKIANAATSAAVRAVISAHPLMKPSTPEKK